MGDWRHFGERLEVALATPECAPTPDSYRVPNREPRGTSGFVKDELSRVIEGEILPRLMLAHRESNHARRIEVERRPSANQIARFSAMLLDPQERNVAAHVLELLDEGLSLESLLLDLLTPAARQLGVMWEEDECDFVDVTLAIGRLQAVTRELCAQLENQIGPGVGRSILLLPCPGETHTYCLSIVATFFREAGWDVTTAGTEPGVDLLDLVKIEWFDVIGFTLSCETLVPALAEAVRSLRKASCNRSVRILVGGPHFARSPDHVLTVGADATAEDGRIAPHIAESLLEKRARAC